MRVLGEFLIVPGKSSRPPRRRPAGYALAVVLVPLLTLLLAMLRGQLDPVTGALAFLIAVIAVALAGRAAAAIAEAEAARPIAEADRARTALLGAAGHDLRTPLTAAKAAISCLRSRELPLTAEDHNELLATADESLDLLTHLAASLLDASRLQAGAMPVFPRPSDLGEIITRSLGSLGLRARAVRVSVPAGLPQVIADPTIMERVIANVTANALRYSSAGSAPLLIASACGDRVEVHVVDHGPGVPQADRKRMFIPFQGVGDTGSATGVGLGLSVCRGLTEAMHGTLEPEETRGGGMTMIISMPAVRGPGRARSGSPGRRQMETVSTGQAPLGCSGVRLGSR